MFFKCEWVKQISHYKFLYLGIEMTDKNIILNCLIVSIGKFMNIPCIKVIQVIAVCKYEGPNEFQTAIQSRLGYYLIIFLSNLNRKYC